MNVGIIDEHLDLKALVKAHQAGIWRYLHFLGCDSAQADDITQETFLKVMRVPFEQRSFPQTQAYLRTIARRIFLSLVDRACYRLPHVPLDEIDIVWARESDSDGGEDRVAALRQCLEAIEPSGRQALGLQYEKKASRKDIAGALDMSEGGVKNLLRRAKDALRECIERRLRR